MNNINLTTYSDKYLDDIISLWNESVVPYSIFKEFTKESFLNKFVNNSMVEKEGIILALNGEELVGFGNANINNQQKDPDKTPGYITLVAVKTKYQRQGIGTKILNALEDYLKSKGKKYVRNFFGNPVNLEWYIPGTDKHDHPGAPAVSYNTPYYFLLMANGYNVNGQLDGYHLNIENYQMPQRVIDKMAENKKDGYEITVYNENLHHGFKELFEHLENEGWHNAVKNNLAKEKPDPMLIAQKDGVILGWTGPLHNQESGRGYFAGIGVDPNVQGRGLGKALFCSLCNESRINGAKFMTLFTGSDNSARNIYLYAGFKIVQSFTILRKDFR